MTVTVYLVDLKCPTRQIRAVQAEIVKHTRAWAETPPTRGQMSRRYLLGASAFQTEASAKRAKLALLVKQSKVTWLGIHYRWILEAVRAQLADPNHRGWQVRVVN